MYNPRAAKTTGFFKRLFRRVAGMDLRASGRWYRPAIGKKGTVDSRQRSWRIKKISQKAMLFILMPLVVFSLGWLAYVMLLHSDIFRMTSVSVKGNQVTTPAQILKTAGLQRGVNLLTLDVSAIEASVRQEQWVDQVWLKRHWPSTVEIIIREYKPFALINLERDGIRQLYYMDSKGEVFAPSTAERDLDYPVVNGAGLAEDLQGKRFRENSLGATAFDFLKLTARGNQILPTQAVSEISVDRENGLIVYLVDHPFPIYMGKDKIRLRFDRLVRILAKLYRDDSIKGVGEIRMDYGEDKILVAGVDEASREK
ncbi:MAG: FtsQ-type POTRA domain-containing protein [Desulfobulbaceae bacterium]|nr:FtsQ-type POTRA domain-containing protein [Desulfobulbaceae bacterium]